MQPKVGFVPIGGTIYNREEIENVCTGCLKALRNSNVKLVEVTSEVILDTKKIGDISDCLRKENVDLVLVLFCSWASEEILNFLSNQLPQFPFLLWGVTKPYQVVSPCGLISAATNFKKSNRKFQYLLEEPEKETIQRIEILARACMVVKKLATTKIGVIGYTPFGMLDVTFSEGDLLKLGPGLIHMDTLDLIRRFESIPENDAERVILPIIRQVGEVDVSKEESIESARMYLALKELVKEFDLSALGVRCWPELREERKLPVCFGFSRLSDEGIPGVCENDVNKGIIQLILQWLTDTPTFLGDPSVIDFHNNTFLLWHCGAAGTRLAKNMKSVQLRKNMFSQRGVSVSFPIKERQVTVASLSGPIDGEFKVLFCKGEVKENSMQVGNYAKIKFEKPIRQILDAIINEGMGHHLVLGLGDVREELKQLSVLLGLHSVL